MMRACHTRLASRPKTSSATDDASPPFDHTMKRTASQTFSSSTCYDADRYGMALDAVNEGEPGESALSRALGNFAGTFTRQKSRRRLSSFSSASTAPARHRRGSIQSFIDSLPSTAAQRKPSSEHARLPLPHTDSGLPPLPVLTPSPSSANKGFSLKRFSSMRRKPASPAESAKAPQHHTGLLAAQLMGGASARQAAAAANESRLSQLRREQEHTHRFLNGLISSDKPHFSDVDFNDNESGVDMTCSSPMVRTDSAADKKMSESAASSHPNTANENSSADPFQRLPAELATAVLSNLDATSLARAEQVSRHWHEHASSSHVWRNVFLRKYEPEVHVSPAPIQMGGTGVGKQANGKPAPAQDWKKMYSARSTINKRWKAGTPAAIYLNGHTDSVYCCQFDENKCITGSRDRTIRVWDLKTYKCVKVYGGPNHRPTMNTPLPMEERSERVISHASVNGTKQGNKIYNIPSDYHDASILCLQYDHEIMVTGSSDYTCIVWDITGEEYIPMYRLRGHEAGVLDVCLDDKYIISCSKDAMIKVWDRKTGVCIRTLKGHRGPVNAVQLRGNLLVSASGDGMAKLWNLETGASIKDFPSEDRGLAAVEFSDDAKYVLAGGNDHVVYKFDANSGNLVHSRVKHDGLVRSLFLDAFNGRIVSGSYDQSIQVSDYETGATYAVYKNWTTSWILSAKSDYRRVLATSQDGRTLILDFGHNVPGSELLVGDK
ncbi:F-box/WD repeat-containing protein lin-23 [Boeremia exigua]|uniref:F-box/WD repeat-containing protein lin-23 n=1 Tax=Boeremia exigua TaxID=749465 RepID=UPI001E8CFDD3|nr:F-box/WD repeat-containing protein lin-23 [Boeremia exigua]KAH6633672.1 F-box/WD repeat-containing protein lin-23 [Boeremia exigua]